MEIKSISEKIFRTSPSKTESNSNQTNPFGVSFKGSMISADVFETKEKSEKNISFRGSELAAQAGAKCKMAISAAIGSINQAISTRLDSVVSFGRKIGEKAVKAWNDLSTHNFRLSFGVVERNSEALVKFGLFGNSYNNKPVSFLEGLFEELANGRAQQEVVA